jgi:hypothetical protein
MYNVEYFYNKFEAIPEEKWTTGSKGWHGPEFCVLGHCSEGPGIGHTDESRAFRELIERVGDRMGYLVNDGTNQFEQLGLTPKERVLNALILIDSGIFEETK